MKTFECCLGTTVIIEPDKDGNEHKCSTTILMDKASHKAIACRDVREEVSGAVGSATSQLIKCSEQYGDDKVSVNGNISVTLTATVIGEDKNTIYVTDATYEMQNSEKAQTTQQDNTSDNFDVDDPYHTHWTSSSLNHIDMPDILLDRQSVEKAVEEAFDHRLFSHDWKTLVQLNGGIVKDNGKDNLTRTKDWIVEDIMSGYISLDQLPEHFKSKLRKSESGHIYNRTVMRIIMDRTIL